MLTTLPAIILVWNPSELKFYAAWLGDKGQYIDSVLSVNRYHNKLSAEKY